MLIPKVQFPDSSSKGSLMARPAPLLLLALALCLPFPPTAARAQDPATPVQAQQATPPRPSASLRVGVAPREPWAFKDGRGDWDGVAVVLWDQMTKQQELQGVRTQWVEIEAGQAGALGAIRQGQVDLVLVADADLEAEEIGDVLPPYHRSVLGVMRPQSQKLWRVAKSFMTFSFLKIVLGVCVLLFLVGALIWWAERKENDDHFDPSPKKGLWAGFWWSCVTMTTIGYGDKTPKTVAGRIVAMCWMVVAMGVTAALTAAMTSASLMPGSGMSVDVPGDLRQMKLGVVKGHGIGPYLKAERLEVTTFDSAYQAQEALRDQKVDAVIDDAARLRYFEQSAWGNQDFVLTTTKVPLTQAALLSSPISPVPAEMIRRALWRRITSESWQNVPGRFMSDQK